MIRLEEAWVLGLFGFLFSISLGASLWYGLFFLGMVSSQFFNDRLDGPFLRFAPGKVYAHGEGYVFQVLHNGIMYVYPEIFSTPAKATRAQKRFCRRPRSMNHLM